jgi:hypothetical protein
MQIPPSPAKKKKTVIMTVVYLVLTAVILGASGYVYLMSTRAQSCYTVDQVKTETTKCLYIYKNGVYEKGTPSAPHHGIPCGTDVSSIIPDSHILDKIGHLDPNYKGDICSATPVNTATPVPSNTPVPSATSAPTSAPLPTATSAPAPTSILPTSASLPTATTAPLSVVTPTATQITQNTQLGATATPALTSAVPTSTLTPTPTVNLAAVTSPTISNLPVTGGEHTTTNLMIVGVPLIIIGTLGLLF